MGLYTLVVSVLKDSENADIPIMAPGFGSDFVELIEQNRRRSNATSRILRLRHGEIWPDLPAVQLWQAGDGMLKRDIGVFRVPKLEKANHLFVFAVTMQIIGKKRPAVLVIMAIGAEVFPVAAVLRVI